MGLIISDIFKQIKSDVLFSNIGGPIQNSSDIMTAFSIDDAVNHWVSFEFEEARSVAWEAFRQILTKSEKRNEWRDKFSSFKAELIKNLDNNKNVHLILNKSGQSLEQFCAALPHIGAAGEILTGVTGFDFFSSQINFYSRGHWICGWRGIFSETEFIYPEKKFIIF